MIVGTKCKGRGRDWSPAILLLLVALPVRAQTVLPERLRSLLIPGERVASCQPCGTDCWLVFAGAPDDTSAGRVVRLVGREGAAVRRVDEGLWVRSDLAGAAALVRAFGDLTPSQVHAALEASRPQVRVREVVREVRRQAAAAAGDDPVVTVSLGRENESAQDGRVLVVHLAPGGAFVESRGIATH